MEICPKTRSSVGAVTSMRPSAWTVSFDISTTPPVTVSTPPTVTSAYRPSSMVLDDPDQTVTFSVPGDTEWATGKAGMATQSVTVP
jgi:hypothetical protein